VKWKLALAALALALIFIATRMMRVPFAPGDTPDGAYGRIAKSLSEGHAREIFPYLETEAQWASISVREARKAAYARVLKSYPQDDGAALIAELRPMAETLDGEDAFVKTAETRGWLARLRRDLSGPRSLEISGDRATVVTARGTRYAFRRRDNGIWGMTMFTAALVADREKATRDLAVVNAAADDYDRARK
jgi:hypothetical protein